MEPIKKPHIAILGFGVEGQSAYRYWGEKGADITVHDQNPSLQIPAGLKSVLGSKAYEDLDSYNYDFLVRSPGNRIDLRIKTPITSPTQEFFLRCPAPIIGVTGTKGKGTTSSLIYEILLAAGKKVHLVGNIGKPALDELINISASDWVVFELSSFQLYDLQRSPHVAVHLMLEADHQDWHASMSEYANAKANIFKFQKPQDVAVYYADSKQVRESLKLSNAKIKIPYSKDMDENTGARVVDGRIYMHDNYVAPVSEVSLRGAHMLDNVCAAVAATWDIVCPSDQPSQLYNSVLRAFKGLPHRVQYIATIAGVDYIDDSYSATPSAAIAGIKAFDSPKVVILGGHDKRAEFSKLACEVVKNNVRHAVLVGTTAQSIADALEKTGFKNYSMGASTMKEIVDQARSYAKRGDVVLLSPGCASFDMFKNFTDRGEQFTDAVEELS